MHVDFHTSSSKCKGLCEGKGVLLSHSALQNTQGDHLVRVVFNHKKHYNRLLKNVSNKKGFRFDPKHIEGLGLWDNVKKGFKFVYNHAKKHTAPVLKKATPYLTKLAAEGAKAATHYATNNPELAETAGNYVKSAAPYLINEGIDRFHDYINHDQQGSGLKIRRRVTKGGRSLWSRISSGDWFKDKGNEINHAVIQPIVHTAEDVGNTIASQAPSLGANAIKSTLSALGSAAGGVAGAEIGMPIVGAAAGGTTGAIIGDQINKAIGIGGKLKRGRKLKGGAVLVRPIVREAVINPQEQVAIKNSGGGLIQDARNLIGAGVNTPNARRGRGQIVRGGEGIIDSARDFIGCGVATPQYHNLKKGREAGGYGTLVGGVPVACKYCGGSFLGLGQHSGGSMLGL